MQWIFGVLIFEDALFDIHFWISEHRHKGAEMQMEEETTKHLEKGNDTFHLVLYQALSYVQRKRWTNLPTHCTLTPCWSTRCTSSRFSPLALHPGYKHLNDCWLCCLAWCWRIGSLCNAKSKLSRKQRKEKETLGIWQKRKMYCTRT